jgi:hypothetical protein
MQDETLSFATVLGDSLRRVGRHWIFFLVLGLANLVLYTPFSYLTAHLAGQSGFDYTNLLVIVYGVQALHALVGCLVYGIIIHFAYQAVHRGEASAGEALSAALRRWPALIWTMVVRYFWLALGFVLLVVPGVIWAYRQMLCWVVTAIEGVSGQPALRRAQDLAQADPSAYNILFGHWLLAIVMTAIPGYFVNLSLITLPLELRTSLQGCLGILNWFIFGVAYFSMVRVYSHLRDRLDGAPEEDSIGFSPAFEL